MDKKTTIIIAVISCCLLLAIIVVCTRGCNKSEPKKNVVIPKPKVDNNIEEEIIKEPKQKKQSFGRKSSFGKPSAMLSDSDKVRLANSYKEDRKILAEVKKDWMKKMLEDPNISKKQYEKLKLRSNPSFIKGMVYEEKQEYDKAIVSYNEILKDSEATPVSKFFACSQLMDVAKATHDFDLYFIAAKMRAKLGEEEDLSILGIEKTEKNEEGVPLSIELINEVENILKARNDKKYFDMLVEARLEENKDAEYEKKPTKEQVIDEVKKDIEYYSNIYKDLI